MLILSRCVADRVSVYAFTIATLVRRGAVPVDGEWGLYITAVHRRPPLSLTRGSSKRLSIHFSDEDGGLRCTRVEVYLESPVLNLMVFTAASLAIASPIAYALGCPPASIASAVASAALTSTILPVSTANMNWVLSLLEEACMDAQEYPLDARVKCGVDCGEDGRYYVCNIDYVESSDVLEAILSTIGFRRVSEGLAKAKGLTLRYLCRPGRGCTIAIAKSGVVTSQTCMLISRLVAELACRPTSIREWGAPRPS